MRIVLVVILVSIAVDLLASAGLIVLVWLEHRRVRREAAVSGEAISSAGGQLGCLLACLLFGLVIFSVLAWLLYE
jgi:hypothetical protein